MNPSTDIATLAVLLLVVVAAALGVAGLGRRRAASLALDEDTYPGLKRLRAATLAGRRLGLAAAGVVGFGATLALQSTAWPFAVPALCGIVLIAGILLGQRAAYGAARVPGVAGLERRQGRSYLPRQLSALVATVALLLAGGAVHTTWVASPDLDQPGALRALTTTCIEEVYSAEGPVPPGAHTQTSTPFPGAYYTVPMAVAVAVLVVVAIVALVVIARRPRNASDPVLVRADDALRRIAAEGVLAAVGLAVAGSLLEVAALAWPQFGKASCDVGNAVSAWLYAALALVALGFCVRFLVLVLVPGNGEDA